MSGYNYLKASDGTGPTALAHIETLRIVGSTVINVDTVDNFPTDHFILTTGTLNASGYITAASMCEMRCHVLAGDIIIDSFEPGYSDTGNAAGQVAIIKQTTGWADSMVTNAQVSHNDDGTMKTSAVQLALNISGAIPPDYNVLGVAPTSPTALGNRSYSMVFAGIDYTDRLQAGTRIRSTRTVSAPINCTSLNGTTQYYSKTSPAATTFTDDFTASAWIKLSSYATTAGIISRYNGTSGFELYIDTSGRVTLVGHNAGAGNYSQVSSYQAVPLNKWVHVAAQLDMSAFTATTTTSYVMIDGADVPAFVSRAGSNPTALVQAGDLQVGASNSGIFFPGKIAQAAIYNAKVTQANILSRISQTLAGNETALISAYSFNNVITDLNTTNVNNLTANGAAVATNVDTPYGNSKGLIFDYGIIQSVIFSVNTTIIVQVPEGCTIPTSGGIASVAYSSVKTPFGFPMQYSKWSVVALYRVDMLYTGAPTPNVWYAIPGMSLTIPVGAWELGYQGTLFGFNSAFNVGVAVTLSPTTAAETDSEFSSGMQNNINNSVNHTPVSRYRDRDITTQQVQYMNAKHNSGGLSQMGFSTTMNVATEVLMSMIEAKNGYL